MPTVTDVKRLAVDLRPFVNAVLMAELFAKMERERVRPIYAEVLDYCDVRDKRTGERITDPDKAWRMSDEAAAEYYPECDKRIHEVEGWRSLPKGHCPALVAEGIQRDAERLMFTEAAKVFPELHPDRLYCSRLELIRKGRELLMGLVINAPGYIPPKLKPAA